MKKLLSITLSMVFAFSLWAQEDGICKDLSNIIEAESRNGALLLDFRASEFAEDYNVNYHRMEWNIDPAAYYIGGTVTTYFKPATDDFDEINFDFSSMLTVHEVSYHGDTLSYEQTDEDVLRITLPAIIPSGQQDSIAITYEGAPPQTGFGSFNQTTHNGTPVLWTLSEPYGARDWWPCKQDLNDKIDSIDVIVRTDTAYRVASNGVLAAEITDGEEKIYHWKHRYPIPAYLVAIAVTNYAVYSDFVPIEDGDDIEVLNYVYPEDLAYAQASTPNTVASILLFNDLVGMYPFADEKYGHAQFSWGGGMEHQTMSFMVNFKQYLQEHELAHQWFGDKITCGSWEDIWLNEGFATYFEGLCREFGVSVNSWTGFLTGKINSITSQPGGSVKVSDTTSVSRIFSGRLSYSKGAMLLHMLRWKMGDEDFFQSLKNYLNDPELAYGYAKTPDLVAHLEAQSNLDLTEFFEDWYSGEGYPSYEIEWWSSGTDAGVTIGQTTSHTSVDFFEMPVPIRFSGEGQEATIVFDHSFSGESFNVALPFEAESATFDPDYWLISRNNTVTQVPVGVNDLSALATSIELFPNPVADQLKVQSDYLVKTAKIFDVSGRPVLRLDPEQQYFEMEVGHLPAGHYSLQLMTEEGQISKVFVK